MNNEFDDLRDFWNKESCGERYSSGLSLEEKFFSQKTERYRLEPYILEFGRFHDFVGKDMLEVGADHLEIAKQKP